MAEYINLGTPTVFFRFKQKAYSYEFGAVLNNIFHPGLRYGGNVEIFIDSGTTKIRIYPFIAIVPSDTNVLNNLEYFAIIRTSTNIDIVLDTASFPANTSKYIYLEYDYTKDIVNSSIYKLKIENTISSSVPYPIILAKIIRKYDDGDPSNVLNQFVVDYSETTYSDIYSPYSINLSSRKLDIINNFELIDINSKNFYLNNYRISSREDSNNIERITNPEIISEFENNSSLNLYLPDRDLVLCLGAFVLGYTSLYFFIEKLLNSISSPPSDLFSILDSSVTVPNPFYGDQIHWFITEKVLPNIDNHTWNTFSDFVSLFSLFNSAYSSEIYSAFFSNFNISTFYSMLPSSAPIINITNSKVDKVHKQFLVVPDLLHKFEYRNSGFSTLSSYLSAIYCMKL